MITLTVVDEVLNNSKKSKALETVSMSMKTYNYLCRLASKQNVLAGITEGKIEMDFQYFIDLLTQAHYAEVNYHPVLALDESLAS